MKYMSKSRGSRPSGGESRIGMGYGARQHQDVVPDKGMGPSGNCKAIMPWGTAPTVAKPPVGAGKGFKGWG